MSGNSTVADPPPSRSTVRVRSIVAAPGALRTSRAGTPGAGMGPALRITAETVASSPGRGDSGAHEAATTPTFLANPRPTSTNRTVNPDGIRAGSPRPRPER